MEVIIAFTAILLFNNGGKTHIQKNHLIIHMKMKNLLKNFEKLLLIIWNKYLRSLKFIKIPLNQSLIAAKDCKREKIWRNKLFSNYKANRANGPEDGFMGGPFFKMVYEESLFIQGGAKTILQHPKLEADDCIAITVKYLLNTNPSCNIYIITSDKDYLQIASDRVYLYNLLFKNLAEQKSSSGDSECDLFMKILTGDPSDNIPSIFPKCGPKTALKYFNNRELLNKKLEESEEYKKQYEINKTLIDFNNIPEHIVNEFLSMPINLDN